MPFAKGVVHLGHHTFEISVFPKAIVEAHRVEYAHKVSGLRNKADTLNLVGKAALPEKVHDLILNGFFSPVKVVCIIDGYRPHPIIAEKGKLFIHLKEFVQVYAVKVQGISQPVKSRFQANVLDKTFVDLRPHDSIPNDLATVAADFTASS
jgi:hypothetical protein